MIKKNIVSSLPIMILFLCLGTNGQAFELNGFADVSFTKCTDPCGEEEGRNGNFAFGLIDFYVAHQIEDIDILLEMGLEDGDQIDLERLTIGYTFSDVLRLRVGRFHTPIGFWNTAYHHGVQLQPTIHRPEVLEFEDDNGVLPIHGVGIYLSGRHKTSLLTMEYGMVFANGARITSHEGSNRLSPNNMEDNSAGKAVGISVIISPAALTGLKVGGATHLARIRSDGSVVGVNSVVDIDDADGDGNPSTGADVDVDQTILNGSLMYTVGDLDFMGEYYAIKNKDKVTGTGSKTSDAYYGLVTYTVTDHWVPYILYEKTEVKETDPYFITLGTTDMAKSHGGLRYNINYRSSVRAEFVRIKEGRVDWNEYDLQWALAF